ncbi:MAG TPA: beta-galactosidase, partial [Microbacterium sp.]|nr:beta-galactosidase [Microbacterium sp.]
FGRGHGWYVATMPDAAGIDAVVAAVVAASGVVPVVTGLPSGVEAARRGSLTTVINHGDEAAWIDVDGTDVETGARVGRRLLDPQGVLFALSPSPVDETAREAPAAPAEALASR